MRVWLRWSMGIGIAALLVFVPMMHYRATYAHVKRLREVTPGEFYRCGQLTASGFREAFRRYGIRTVVNLQDEDPDPLVPESFYDDKRLTPESEVCRQEGVRYVMISFDMPRRDQAPSRHAQSIDDFLKLLDQPGTSPILLHCKAGLHRTGLLTAIYRMEYQHWTKAEAMRELRANGFGDAAANTGNDYVFAYIEHYTPRWQRRATIATAGKDAP